MSTAYYAYDLGTVLSPSFDWYNKVKFSFLFIYIYIYKES